VVIFCGQCGQGEQGGGERDCCEGLVCFRVSVDNTDNADYNFQHPSVHWRRGSAPGAVEAREDCLGNKEAAVGVQVPAATACSIP
jgi:hypothetical protein